MNIIQTVILGAIAGFTIYIGLPVGRVDRVSERVRAFLTMLSVGILIFLLFDVLTHIHEPIDQALNNALAGKPPWENLPLSSAFLLWACRSGCSV